MQIFYHHYADQVCLDDPLSNLQICLAIPDTTIRAENHYLSRTTKWQAIVLNCQDAEG
ncbi:MULTISPECIES: hypothetical protein [Nostocales]|uniref:hypothetical protein n=1 Tax=Nostocales TaxID=1161 RepID=UPI001686D3F3|nr:MULTISPECIES: hypothetical protein [Nostocales]MBD2301778.1 hypothetical protein [Nostoc sp. FACHB-190]MBD2478044.1 hypothetical protein [Anabaena sp. FACHB-83]MBD2490870.1 hypothetical protein [Aulosira sp. FACHB-615]